MNIHTRVGKVKKKNNCDPISSGEDSRECRETGSLILCLKECKMPLLKRVWQCLIKLTCVSYIHSWWHTVKKPYVHTKTCTQCSQSL